MGYKLGRDTRPGQEPVLSALDVCTANIIGPNTMVNDVDAMPKTKEKMNKGLFNH